jgi:hypothetical protein
MFGKILQRVKWKLVWLIVVGMAHSLLDTLWVAMEPPTMGAAIKAQVSNDVATYAAGRTVQMTDWSYMWHVPCAVVTLILIGFIVRDVIQTLKDEQKENENA